MTSVIATEVSSIVTTLTMAAANKSVNAGGDSSGDAQAPQAKEGKLCVCVERRRESIAWVQS